MTQPDYTGKKILFTAFSVIAGSEAIPGCEFLKRHGATDITTLYWGGAAIADNIPADVQKIEIDPENFDSSLTEGYDLVFRHQTTRPELIHSPITTNTVEFFKYCPAPIVGVTGTKGKGTTCTLITRMLEGAGKSVRLLGNIGDQAIAQLDSIQPDDIVVFELSSFQLWDLEQSPETAVVLMITEDHQDVHSSMDEYVAAKARIAQYQKADDVVFYHPSNELTAQAVADAGGEKVPFMTAEAAHVADGMVRYKDVDILPASEVGLLGEHNLENVCAAVSAAWQYTQDTAAIAAAIRDFTGLEHRLEEVTTVAGVRYVNDSFSAAPAAAIAAVHAFDEPIVAIVGGYDRGISFTDFANSLQDTNVKQLVLIGESRGVIAAELDASGFTAYTVSNAQDMAGVLQDAVVHTEPGDVVILSPGSASFDMFENYKDRGTQFKQEVAKRIHG